MSSSKSFSAILPNGRINVSQLQSEVSQAICHDFQFHREDEMKKRAIHICKDYSEFKAFVSCSHLKPVNSSDMDSLFVTRKGGRRGTGSNQVKMNRGYKEIDSIFAAPPLEKDTVSLTSPIKSKKNATKIPSTSMDLEKEWTSYCKNIESTLRYLLLSTEESPRYQVPSLDDISLPESPRISPKNFQRLCRYEITPIMLGGIVTALCCLTKLKIADNFPERVAEFVSHWLISITKCGRYELSLNFLSNEEKSSLRSLVKYVGDSGKIVESISHMMSILKNE
jgi:hypothetical protein